MTEQRVDISGVRNLDTLLENLPAGSDARRLATRLGVWTNQSHEGAMDRKRPYPTEFAKMGDDELSDVYSYWLSEAARATELVGLLEGQKVVLSLTSKQARAAARGRVRTRNEGLLDDKDKPVKLTATQIADEAEADSAVVDVETTSALLEMALAGAKAYKEATNTMVTGISREISFRQAQYSARLRG